MNLLIYLLLAHFLADYPLQSGRLVQLKMQRFLGVFIHVLIHLGVMVVVLFPFLHSAKLWIGLGVVYVTHNLIDQTKVQLDKRNPEKSRFFYFLDQFLHWSIIVAVSFFVGDLQPSLPQSWLNFYSNQIVVYYIFCAVLSTYFYDVTRYFVLLKKDSPPYERDYKTMLRNAAIITLGFGMYWLFY